MLRITKIKIILNNKKTIKFIADTKEIFSKKDADLKLELRTDEFSRVSELKKLYQFDPNVVVEDIVEVSYLGFKDIKKSTVDVIFSS